MSLIPITDIMGRSNPSPVVDLWEFSGGGLGTTTQRMASDTNATGSNIVWLGNTYTATPLRISGIGERAGRPQRAVLRIGIVGRTGRTGDQFKGALAKMTRTLKTYIDSSSNRTFPIYQWRVGRTNNWQRGWLEVELIDIAEEQNRQTPRRWVSKHCPWAYRGAECGYTGTRYYRADNAVTSKKEEDVCAKSEAACKLRFPAASELPFGAVGASIFTDALEIAPQIVNPDAGVVPAGTLPPGSRRAIRGNETEVVPVLYGQRLITPSSIQVVQVPPVIEPHGVVRSVQDASIFRGVSNQNLIVFDDAIDIGFDEREELAADNRALDVLSEGPIEGWVTDQETDLVADALPTAVATQFEGQTIRDRFVAALTTIQTNTYESSLVVSDTTAVDGVLSGIDSARNISNEFFSAVGSAVARSIPSRSEYSRLSTEVTGKASGNAVLLRVEAENIRQYTVAVRSPVADPLITVFALAVYVGSKKYIYRIGARGNYAFDLIFENADTSAAETSIRVQFAWIFHTLPAAGWNRQVTSPSGTVRLKVGSPTGSAKQPLKGRKLTATASLSATSTSEWSPSGGRQYRLRGRKVLTPLAVSADGQVSGHFAGAADVDDQETAKWTRDPAWILLDLLRSDVYGMGLMESEIDLRSIYLASAYNNETVSVGKKKIPRHRCDLYLTSKRNTRQVAEEIAASMDATLTWHDGRMTIVQNRPAGWGFPSTSQLHYRELRQTTEHCHHLFCPANVVDGEFRYSLAEEPANVVTVRYTDLEGEQDVIRIEDQAGLQAAGEISLSLDAPWCSESAYAEEYAARTLFDGQNRRERIKFRCGPEAWIDLRVGDIIRVADPERENDVRGGGRITRVSGRNLYLDQRHQLAVGEHIWYQATIRTDPQLDDSLVRRATIKNDTGTHITMDALVGAITNGIWVAEKASTRWVVEEFVQQGMTVEITARLYRPDRWTAIAAAAGTGVTVTAPKPRPPAPKPPAPILPPPTGISFSAGEETAVTANGFTVTPKRVTVNWAAVNDARSYEIVTNITDADGTTTTTNRISTPSWTTPVLSVDSRISVSLRTYNRDNVPSSSSSTARYSVTISRVAVPEPPKPAVVPPNVQGLRVSRVTGGLTVSFRKPTQVITNLQVHIRYGADWDLSTSLGSFAVDYSVSRRQSITIRTTANISTLLARFRVGSDGAWSPRATSVRVPAPPRAETAPADVTGFSVTRQVASGGGYDYTFTWTPVSSLPSAAWIYIRSGSSWDAGTPISAGAAPHSGGSASLTLEDSINRGTVFWARYRNKKDSGLYSANPTRYTIPADTPPAVSNVTARGSWNSGGTSATVVIAWTAITAQTGYRLLVRQAAAAAATTRRQQQLDTLTATTATYSYAAVDRSTYGSVLWVAYQSKADDTIGPWTKAEIAAPDTPPAVTGAAATATWDDDANGGDAVLTWTAIPAQTGYRMEARHAATAGSATATIERTSQTLRANEARLDVELGSYYTYGAILWVAYRQESNNRYGPWTRVNLTPPSLPPTPQNFVVRGQLHARPWVTFTWTAPKSPQLYKMWISQGPTAPGNAVNLRSGDVNPADARLADYEPYANQGMYFQAWYTVRADTTNRRASPRVTAILPPLQPENVTAVRPDSSTGGTDFTWDLLPDGSIANRPQAPQLVVQAGDTVIIQIPHRGSQPYNITRRVAPGTLLTCYWQWGQLTAAKSDFFNLHSLNEKPPAVEDWDVEQITIGSQQVMDFEWSDHAAGKTYDLQIRRGKSWSESTHVVNVTSGTRHRVLVSTLPAAPSGQTTTEQNTYWAAWRNLLDKDTRERGVNVGPPVSSVRTIIASTPPAIRGLTYGGIPTARTSAGVSYSTYQINWTKIAAQGNYELIVRRKTSTGAIQHRENLTAESNQARWESITRDPAEDVAVAYRDRTHNTYGAYTLLKIGPVPPDTTSGVDFIRQGTGSGGARLEITWRVPNPIRAILAASWGLNRNTGITQELEFVVRRTNAGGAIVVRTGFPTRFSSTEGYSFTLPSPWRRQTLWVTLASKAGIEGPGRAYTTP